MSILYCCSRSKRKDLNPSIIDKIIMKTRHLFDKESEVRDRIKELKNRGHTCICITDFVGNDFVYCNREVCYNNYLFTLNPVINDLILKGHYCIRIPCGSTQYNFSWCNNAEFCSGINPKDNMYLA